MKKIKTGLLLLSLLLFLLAGTAGAQLRFGFRFYGGLNCLGGGDVNLGAKGWADYYSSDILLPRTPSGKFEPIHLGFDFGGDFILQFTPQLGIGIGSGYLTASKTFSIDHTHPIFDDVLYKSETTIGAIPIRLSFYYFLPVGSNINIYFQAGGSYYLASLKYHFRAEDPSYYEDRDLDTKGGGVGFHGGLGLEIDFSPMVGFFIDLTGRYASISNFKGDFIISDTWSSTTISDANLYFFRYYDWPYGNFPLILVSTIVPSGIGITDVHQAKIDFSGFSALLGFIFRF
ncbi:MAG: outer membrane beta-barrel protein [Candidatus Aminicenantales bacterium]